MKKLKSLFVAAAILAVTTFTFSCADPNAKNPDQNPSNENTTEAPKEDPVPEVVKKTIESEEDFQKAMEELYAEIAAFFMPAPNANMRVAAPTEAELFEGDKAIEPLSEFIAAFLKAVLEADQDSVLDPLSPFELEDSINVKNLSFDQIIKAIDKFITKEENKNMVKEMFGSCDSADELLEDAFEPEDLEEFKAKLNDSVTLTKLKYSGSLIIDPIEIRKFDINEESTSDSDKYELTSEIMGKFEISNLNEELGLKVEKLDSLLQFLTGNTAVFPIKNVTVDEALKIQDALFMVTMEEGEPGPLPGTEEEKDEWMAGGTSSDSCPDPEEFGIDGTASSKIAFDFETASYKGTIEVSLNLEATTELFQNIMGTIEKDSEGFPVELFNELGGITVSVKDSEISQSFKLGDLIAMTL
ncbi:MAG: hypothetical protein MJ185_02545 [Treponema sp.]|nr:hypothetical protein [Treponema sp.]